MQCRNCKIMWLIITDTDIILMSDGQSFPIDKRSIDPLLNIIKILPTT